MGSGLVNTIVRVKRVSSCVIGVEIDLPDAPPLILLRGKKGFVVCGYLDASVAEKLGLIAARVSGVTSVEDMLNKEVTWSSSKAMEQGIKPGVKVSEIIDKL